MDPANYKILSFRVFWLLLAAGLLAVDFLSSAVIQFPITFIFPVMLAAFHGRPVWALLFAVALPLARCGLIFLWRDVPWSAGVELLNSVIRGGVLTVVALLTFKLGVQYRQLKTKVVRLEGLLPICTNCKKIRDDRGDWQPMESYFATRTNIVFNHRCCPDCNRAAVDAAHPPGDPQMLSFCE